MVKKDKTIKIRLSISNRLLYTIIAVLLIVGIGAVVYAVAPNPGHSAEQIDGLVSNYCHKDASGTYLNCPTGTTDSRIDSTIKGLYVDSTAYKLCYSYDKPNPGTCSQTQQTCSSTKSEEISITVGQDGINDYVCTNECSGRVACSGIISQCSGYGTTVNYNKGTKVVGTNNKCKCSFTSTANRNYNQASYSTGSGTTRTSKCI